MCPELDGLIIRSAAEMPEIVVGLSGGTSLFNFKQRQLAGHQVCRWFRTGPVRVVLVRVYCLLAGQAGHLTSSSYRTRVGRRPRLTAARLVHEQQRWAPAGGSLWRDATKSRTFARLRSAERYDSSCNFHFWNNKSHNFPRPGILFYFCTCERTRQSRFSFRARESIVLFPLAHNLNKLSYTA